MALTMTRTRTQTTLTKLCEAVARCHGELAFVDATRAEANERLRLGELRRGETLEAVQQLVTALEARSAQLHVARDALYLTIRRFDASLDPTRIGELDDWLKPFGRGASRAAKDRYVSALSAGQT